MPKSFKPREVLNKFEKLGFVVDRQSGSHKILYNPITQKRAVIPFHVRELPKGTFTSILRESGVSKDEFEKA